MVFNHCIYGTIDKDIEESEYLRLTYYNYNFKEVYTKEFSLVSSNYQFNLGDSDLKGINSSITNEDVVILEYFNSTDKLYSAKVVLDKTNNIQEHNIVMSDYKENDAEASFIVSENIIKTSNYRLNELSTSLYNYFTITDLSDDSLIFESNKSEFHFLPQSSHKYKITQQSLNESSNIITTKEYEFNAIVGSTSISRSSKCKNINDSIKIIFQGFSDYTPLIDIIKDDEVFESGTMSADNNNLYSYNFNFPSKGYFLFSITYGDEVFLIDFRVLQSNFKIYYSDVNHLDNLDLEYSCYDILDTNNVVHTGTLTNIKEGLYSSDLMPIKYADYLFIVEDNEYISSFEECLGSSNDSAKGSNNCTEEVYWIIPDSLND